MASLASVISPFSFFNVNNQLQTLAHTQEIRVTGVRGWECEGVGGVPLFIKDANKYLVNAACGPASRHANVLRLPQTFAATWGVKFRFKCHRRRHTFALEVEIHTGAHGRKCLLKVLSSSSI